MVVVFIFQETNGHILAVVSESAYLFSFIVAPTQTCADVAEPWFRDFSHKAASGAHVGNERRREKLTNMCVCEVKCKGGEQGCVILLDDIVDCGSGCPVHMWMWDPPRDGLTTQRG
jgi:hypothetical protein